MTNNTSLNTQEYLFTNNKWQTLYPSDHYKRKVTHAKEHPIHYLLGLNQSDSTIVKYVNELNAHTIRHLVKKDEKNYHLTPLIIAVMRERIIITSALIEKAKTEGVLQKIINQQDAHGWTAMHHAALCSKEIFKILKQYETLLYTKTPLQGTPQDLRLLASKKIRKIDAKHLFFQDMEGHLHPLSSLGQQKMTEYMNLAEYRTHSFLPPQSYYSFWSAQTPYEANHFYQKLFGASIESDRPQLVIAPCQELSESDPLFSLGLYAKEFIPPLTVIEKYSGTITQQSSQLKCLKDQLTTERYLFRHIDSQIIGNASRYSNWGWPNAFMQWLDHRGSCDPYLIALDSIPEGEQICWDYGIFDVRALYAPYTILGASFMRDYFIQGLLSLSSENRTKHQEFIQNINNDHLIQKSFLALQASTSRLLFPLNAPCALLDLHFNRIIQAKEWLTFFEGVFDDKPFAIKLWREEYAYQEPKIVSILMRIQEFEEKFPTNHPLTGNAIKWILNSIGKRSIVEILKGMEWISVWHDQNWEKIEEELKHNLASYHYFEDADSPIGFERACQDRVKLIKKSIINIDVAIESLEHTIPHDSTKDLPQAQESIRIIKRIIEILKSEKN